MRCEDCIHEKVCEGYSNCEEAGLYEPKRPLDLQTSSDTRVLHEYYMAFIRVKDYYRAGVFQRAIEALKEQHGLRKEGDAE